MNRRNFVGLLGSAALIGDSMAEDIRGNLPRGAGVGPEWVGARALAGGKGYAPCRLGQLHYRAVGEGSSIPFLLLHQTPIGLTEYIDVQPALAASSRRSIAPDTPGYGFSDPLEHPVTVQDLGDNLVGLLDHLRVPRVIVAGHHTGAAIAAAFAARHPDRTAAVVLHGAPLYTAEERASRLERLQAAPGIELHADGSHFSELFRETGSHAGIDSQSLSSLTWAAIGSLLSGPGSPVYRAVFSNDMGADVRKIRAPALVLTDTQDVLHPMDRRVVQLRPDFVLQEFSDGRSFSLMREPARWAAAVREFATSRGL